MRRLIAPVALLLLCACAGGQGAPEPAAGAPPANAVAAQRQLNAADRGFLRDAALGGLAEVELGRLASGKAQAPDVKAFAERMQQDHGQANAELAALAGKHGVALPDALDPERQAARARLQQASGAGFDRAYLANQVQEHQQAVQLFQHEINAGQNAELKQVAAAKLPILMEHLDMAQELHAALRGVR